MDDRNTYIFDYTSTAELTRLIDQDRFLSNIMGGPLAGLVLPQGAIVLDLACGPGGWVLDVAFERPDIDVSGVDVSKEMIDYALARARSQGRKNATFGVMDITKPLDFSDATFDLVNARLLVGVLKRDAWLSFLAECTRILKPGGTLRLVEPDDAGSTTSAEFEYLSALALRGLWTSGYGFSHNGRTFGIAPVLLSMMKALGYQTSIASAVGDYSHDSPGWEDFYHNAMITTPQLKRMLINEGIAAEEFDEHYQRQLIEMSQVGFSALWHFNILLGTLPS